MAPDEIEEKKESYTFTIVLNTSFEKSQRLIDLLTHFIEFFGFHISEDFTIGFNKSDLE